MKKKTLDISYSYDFDLLGIISPLKGYKMAWEINNCLNVKLVKDKDLCISFKKKTEFNFSHFSYTSEAWVLKLFRNKPLELELPKVELVPEFPHFDFVLLTQSDDPAKSNRLQEVLRLISSVELV
ncbi:MAG: IPExxxVDY family protein, partial [Cyclobacteriaceae bacterium]|nr:IPExxxVDY family protein [Cyclobacteriaceae bacterium]